MMRNTHPMLCVASSISCSPSRAPGRMLVSTRSARLLVAHSTHISLNSSCNILHQLVCVVESPRGRFRLMPHFSVPNILLAFIPSEISPSTMNIMTAFAVWTTLLLHGWRGILTRSFIGWRPSIRCLRPFNTPLLHGRRRARRGPVHPC